MSRDDLLSREAVLGGLPARRAQALLFLIESRAAHLAARAHELANPLLSEARAQQRDLAYFEAFRLGREPPRRPTIQAIEQFAPRWAPLVPDNPAVRAALAHLLAQKYTFTRGTVPHLRAALGLDAPPVQQAYERLYGRPLPTLYAPGLSVADRLRWLGVAPAWLLGRLPPFWAAFVLLLGVPLPQALLALPIAAEDVGPLPGAALVLAVGLANALTIGYMAEASARSGTLRHGRPVLARLATDYLGALGATLLTGAVALLFLLALVASYLGLSTTLAEVTRVPAPLWCVGLFGVGLWVLARESLGLTVSLLLLFAAVNLLLLAALAGLAEPSVRAANLLVLPAPAPLADPASLQRIVGVALVSFFGHPIVCQSARLVLDRDPSGRGLLWGALAGTAALALLLALWTLVLDGAVGAALLQGAGGTVVPALGTALGPPAIVLGTLLAIVLLGMTALRCTLTLASLVRERLPTPTRLPVTLPRRRGRLVAAPRGWWARGPHLGVTYLGLENGRPRLRVDVQAPAAVQHVELDAPLGQTVALAAHVAALRGTRLDLSPRAATADQLQLDVVTPLALDYVAGGDPVGVRLADTVVQPEVQRRLVTWLMQAQTRS